MIDNMDDFRALDPFFRIIEQGLAGLMDGDHFFDLLAEDVVFDFVITVPDYPRHVVGRDNLIELYRGYGSTFFLDSCYDLRVHHSQATSSVVLEYSSKSRVVRTGQPHSSGRSHPPTAGPERLCLHRDQIRSDALPDQQGHRRLRGTVHQLTLGGR